jgi:hypothetical protein
MAADACRNWKGGREGGVPGRFYGAGAGYGREYGVSKWEAEFKRRTTASDKGYRFCVFQLTVCYTTFQPFDFERSVCWHVRIAAVMSFI